MVGNLLLVLLEIRCIFFEKLPWIKLAAQVAFLTLGSDLSQAISAVQAPLKRVV